MIRRSQEATDRGVSIALTHVLTIGITTILIAMLLMAGSSMLETETDRSTRTALETVGERLAGEIDNVDRIANDSESDTVSIVADHPRTVANSQYTVQLLEESECGGDRAPLLDKSNNCLELSAHGPNVTVHVPVAIDAGVSTDQASAQGGAIEITYIGGPNPDDRVIELTEADR